MIFGKGNAEKISHQVIKCQHHLQNVAANLEKFKVTLQQ